MKLIPRLLAVWLVETLCEILLLSLSVIALLGLHEYSFGQDLKLYIFAIAFFMFMTGYLLTTLLARTLWRVRRIWSYPLAAAVLFLFHFQIMNLGMGGEWEPAISIRIRVAGACIVFACTLAGSFVLRKWAPTGNTASAAANSG
jgi:hypothetical protein